MLAPTPDVERPEPRWPVIVAALAAVALHYSLPQQLRFHPPWLLAAVVVFLVAAAAIARRMHAHKWNSAAAYAILGLLTFSLLVGVVRLVQSVLNNSVEGLELLKSAGILWITNVIVFASWYWRLDAGGPNQREREDSHNEGAFLFPQMTFTVAGDSETTIAEGSSWRPSFIDYLFVAFNTSTAFSPTDAPVLTRWAKSAMMVQAIISFSTVVLIAARAVNIIGAK